MDSIDPGRIHAIAADLNDGARVVEIDPLDDPRWSDLERGTPFGSIFTSSKWLRVLQRAYDFPIRCTAIENASGGLTGGVAHVSISDVRGKRLVSLPFSDYCDPLVADSTAWRRLADALVQRNIPLTFRCLHNEAVLSDPSFTQFKDAKWHSVDLTRSLDEIWDSVETSSRRAIRRAQKQGVQIRRAESKRDLRTFYELHAGVRNQKYRMLAQPYSFFDCIWDEFLEEGLGFLLLAEVNDRVIAGTMYLHHGRTIYYKFNASDLGQLQLRPNDLLVWDGIRRAKEEMGCATYDFGLSDSDQEGLLRFKRKFATEEKTIRFMQHRSTRWETRTVEAEWSHVLPALTELLTSKSVPAGVAEQASSLLYRVFA